MEIETCITIDGGSLVNLTDAWAMTVREQMHTLNADQTFRVIRTLDNVRNVLADRWQHLAAPQEAHDGKDHR